jgi:WD40 repeat protein
MGLSWSAGGKGKIHVWSCTQHRLLGELHDPCTPIYPLGFRSDGRHLLSVALAGSNQVTAWDTVTWQAVRPSGEDLEPATQRIVSPDGRLLAVGTMTGTVRWLDAQTGKLLAAATDSHRHKVSGIAFTGDGTRAASVAEDGTVAFWDPSSLRLIEAFKGHMQGAHGVAFSPDGRRLATGGSGRDAVRLWDLATHRAPLLTLPGQGLLFEFVAFSPDGRWLAACSSDGQLHLWRAPPWDEIDAAGNPPASRPSGAFSP